MDNPFNVILAELAEIKEAIKATPGLQIAPPPEIIDTDELCRRLNISEPTAIKYRRNKTIPFFKIGTSVRYNWINVIKNLETINEEKKVRHSQGFARKSTPEELLSAKTRTQLSKAPTYQRDYSRKKCNEVTDSFVLDQIRRTDLKGFGTVKKSDIPKEVIEAKRQTIILKRKIKKNRS